MFSQRSQGKLFNLKLDLQGFKNLEGLFAIFYNVSKTSQSLKVIFSIEPTPFTPKYLF